MGSMLLHGFISSNKLNQANLIISTKTKSKLNKLKIEFPNINMVDNNIEVINKAKYIFICVKPLDAKNILKEIKNNITNNKGEINQRFF